MKKKCLLTALFGCMVVCASAQISLSGKVVDARTGKPVEGGDALTAQLKKDPKNLLFPEAPPLPH